MTTVYVVATSRKDAEILAGEDFGYPTRADAREHRDHHNQTQRRRYRIWAVRDDNREMSQQ